MNLTDFSPEEKEILLHARNRLLLNQKLAKSGNSDPVLNDSYQRNISILEGITETAELDETLLIYLNQSINDTMLTMLRIQQKIRPMLEKKLQP
jgi:hypothetical protein